MTTLRAEPLCKQPAPAHPVRDYLAIAAANGRCFRIATASLCHS